jgi:hypothetical protein
VEAARDALALAAVATRAAGHVAGLAVERPRKVQGERALADTRRAGDQVGVGQPAGLEPAQQEPAGGVVTEGPPAARGGRRGGARRA